MCTDAPSPPSPPAEDIDARIDRVLTSVKREFETVTGHRTIVDSEPFYRALVRAIIEETSR